MKTIENLVVALHTHYKQEILTAISIPGPCSDHFLRAASNTFCWTFHALQLFFNEAFFPMSRDLRDSYPRDLCSGSAGNATTSLAASCEDQWAEMVAI